VGQGGLWEWRSENGYPVTVLTRLRDLTADNRWTTILTLTLDEGIFTTYEFDATAIESLLFDYAHLLPGLNISFENHITGDRNGFYAPSGLVHYLEQENRYKRTLYPAIGFSIGVGDVLSARELRRGDALPFELTMALQFLATPTPSRRSFVNTCEAGPHGPHIDVCFRALRDCLLGHSNVLSRRDVAYLFDHITLVVSLWHPNPQSENSVHLRLMNRDFVQRAYEDLCVAMTLYFKAHPELLDALETLALSKRPQRRPRLYPVRIRR
jgi:DNA gyrase/topoisomerase IV subunit B